MPSNGFELLNRKETCMVEVWKDAKKDCTIRVIDIWYNSDEENAEGYNLWTHNSKVSQVTTSGKCYKPVEKKVERGIEKEEAIGEKDSDELDDDLILKQLKKAKANVSIWELLMHSSSHRKALVKALSKMSIQTNEIPESMVAKIIENKQGVITFSDADLLVEWRNYNRALFIPAKVKGKRTSYVMVDDGSVINIYPLQILPNLGVKVEELTKSDLVIRAYDDSTRSMKGTFVAPVKTSPIEAVVRFTVLDIPVTYALLLGRPWYHVLGGVPSTVHQKVKFLLDGEVITIYASMSKTVSAARDEQKQVIEPLGFQVAMISAGIEKDPRVSSMIKKMNYRPG